MKYHYQHQVWWDEATGAVRPCEHPDSMRPLVDNPYLPGVKRCKPCCDQWRYRQCHIDDLDYIKDHPSEYDII